MNQCTLFAFTALLFIFCVSCAVPLSQVNGEGPTGDIIIRCDPDDAKVYLDGVYIGRANQFSNPKHPLKVSMGAHVLEFERKDYQLELREIMTRVDSTEVVVKMKLRPKPSEEEKE